MEVKHHFPANIFIRLFSPYIILSYGKGEPDRYPDTSLADTSPDRHFSGQTLPQTLPQTDTYPERHFPERTLPRTYTSPTTRNSDNMQQTGG